MGWADYLLEEAGKYRRLAETAEGAVVKEKFLDLATTCGEVANNTNKVLGFSLTPKFTSGAPRVPVMPVQSV
jgi:hypothetical protein